MTVSLYRLVLRLKRGGYSPALSHTRSRISSRRLTLKVKRVLLWERSFLPGGLMPMTPYVSCNNVEDNQDIA